MEPQADEDRIGRIIVEAKSLITMLEKSSVRRVRLGTGDFQIEIERAFSEGQLGAPTLQAVAVATPDTEGGTTKASAAHHRVLAPLVGTFYRSPNPGAKPFVDVGTRVQRGQAIGIIEVMKVMNQVDSDVDGVVVEVLVQNGQPVHYEQPLIVVDTTPT